MPPLDPFACTREEALIRIREAGITGMGGAGFPAHVKLSPSSNKNIDIIIADGSECEPYLTTDEVVITEKPHFLVKGLAIVMKITDVTRPKGITRASKPVGERSLPKLCAWGCLGFGDCAAVCKFGAISIGKDGLPKIDKTKCTGCKVCVVECPQGIIWDVPKDQQGAFAFCSNWNPVRAMVIKTCKAGCIKCELCVKNCRKNALS
jgi:ferredoxin